MKGRSGGSKGLPTATGGFFLNPSGQKERPGKFVGSDVAMVTVVDREKKYSTYEILKMQVR